MSVNLNYAKRWTDSTTIRGALLAALPVVKAIASLFGLQIESQEWDMAIEGIVGLAGLVGVVMAIYGRTVATARIVK